MQKRCQLFKCMFRILCIFKSAFTCTLRYQLFTRTFTCTTFQVTVSLFLHAFQDVNLCIEVKMSTSPRALAQAHTEMLTECALTSPPFTCTPRCQLLESAVAWAACTKHARCTRYIIYLPLKSDYRSHCIIRPTRFLKCVYFEN